MLLIHFFFFQFSSFNCFLASAAVRWCLWKINANSDGL